MLAVGTKAPRFALPDGAGEMHALTDFKGQWVLLYFYPKDDTPGCTKEACQFRDNFPAFEKLHIAVIGVSVDSEKSHVRFAEKYSLPFLLLSDVSKEVVQAYDVWGLKKFMGREYLGTMRHSFLIDPKGTIAKIYTDVKPEVHAQEVLTDLASLTKKVVAKKTTKDRTKTVQKAKPAKK